MTTSRVFDHRQLWRLSDTAHSEAIGLLSRRAAIRFGPISTVIGIAEGGRVPAERIARRLSLPLEIVTARHNATDDHYLPATGKVACDIGAIRPAGTVLVVDDICGSGATLQAVRSALGVVAAPQSNIMTATLCRNAGASLRPDLVVWDELRDWVVFPWEDQPPGLATDLPLPTTARRQ